MQDASSKQQTNKQNTNPIISRQDYHLTQPCPSEENKQNNKRTQHKKGDLKHNKLFKTVMKTQRNNTPRKEQTRNTEVQINEEELAKLPEKEFRIMIVKMIKNLENKMEKMQESINKDLEELKNKHTETTQLLKLKILQKKSKAEYLKQKNESVSWKIKWWT